MRQRAKDRCCPKLKEFALDAIVRGTRGWIERGFLEEQNVERVKRELFPIQVSVVDLSEPIAHCTSHIASRMLRNTHKRYLNTPCEFLSLPFFLGQIRRSQEGGGASS